MVDLTNIRTLSLRMGFTPHALARRDLGFSFDDMADKHAQRQEPFARTGKSY